MARSIIHEVSLALMILIPTAAAAAPDDSVTLYQIGKAGKYCVSVTKDDSGCISGSKVNGDAVNTLQLMKNKKVVFENLSDAPHDMRFTGKNQADLPTQAPGAGAVAKQMTVEDFMKQKITCSFHGAQLTVGYRVVPDNKGVAGADGHKEVPESLDAPNTAASVAQNAMGEASPGEVPGPEPISPTGLADVSDQVLAKGKSGDVATLIENRPELMDKLKETRPLLAQEIESKKGDAASGQRAAAGAKELAGTGDGGVPSLLPAGGTASETTYEGAIAGTDAPTEETMIAGGINAYTGGEGLSTDQGKLKTYRLRDRAAAAGTLADAGSAGGRDANWLGARRLGKAVVSKEARDRTRLTTAAGAGLELGGKMDWRLGGLGLLFAVAAMGALARWLWKRAGVPKSSINRTPKLVLFKGKRQDEAPRERAA